MTGDSAPGEMCLEPRRGFGARRGSACGGWVSVTIAPYGTAVTRNTWVARHGGGVRRNRSVCANDLGGLYRLALMDHAERRQVVASDALAVP